MKRCTIGLLEIAMLRHWTIYLHNALFIVYTYQIQWYWKNITVLLYENCIWKKNSQGMNDLDGNSRSLELSQFNRSYVTFYQWKNVRILHRFCHVTTFTACDRQVLQYCSTAKITRPYHRNICRCTTIIKPGIEWVQACILADISRLGYVVIATRPVQRLQIRQIAHN